MEYTIVPVANNFGTVVADDRISALEKFADGMDSDMGAYFKAVEEVEGLQPYDKPKNLFELYINGAINVLNGDDKEEKELMEFMKSNLPCIIGLQMFYDKATNAVNEGRVSEKGIEQLTELFETLFEV